MAKQIFDQKNMAPPIGRLPALQYLPPSELEIDSAYQRSIETGESQSLIRAIAAGWNWDLCQPLVVSRREDRFFVIDGQHRLAAALLRGDIQQLPCVVGAYPTMQAEAATFTALNDRRRPLSALDKFKAAVASGEDEAVEILAAIERSGLKLAPPANPGFWDPGMIANVGGIRIAWRQAGATVCEQALAVLAEVYKGQVLQYAGSIFPGLVALCQGRGKAPVDDARLSEILEVIPRKTQGQWRSAQLVYMSENQGVGRDRAMALVMARMVNGGQVATTRPVKAVRELANAEPSEDALPPLERGKDISNFDAVSRGMKKHCGQCDKLRSAADVQICINRWCKLRDVA